ncbi:MAG: hypothetical protein GTO13_15640 [Proteobacteria bacterium]|nr:hypothetical protein [Pseudomonadota bacterium]
MGLQGVILLAANQATGIESTRARNVPSKEIKKVSKVAFPSSSVYGKFGGKNRVTARHTCWKVPTFSQFVPATKIP